MARKPELNFNLPSDEAAARQRMIELGTIINDTKPLAEQLKRLLDAADVLRAAEAEAAFINENLDGIRRNDFERAASGYQIERIEYAPPQSDALANALRQYRVVGTYKGVPLDGKLLSSGDRVMWAAVAAQPALIPADVRGRDADPMTALEKHYRDHARGYISA
ncbi:MULTISPECIES: hypothetical protein [unclassified Caballeronia]|uniref:hypothetical protein n=1 Tax=unclassified Caballeronia TaxID=2646786 RepID=UPI001F33F3BC|nr:MULTISPECIES: hypothetical protein [unclassified Caballeronia]MCE4542124.1 hypothetical protein [Caballeronia sp. PC1]MCE4568830.1 hypothetical protein [Caballeronia sp. CLC5]